MKKWHYDSVRGLDQALVERLRQFPREPDMLVYALRSLSALIIRSLLRIYNQFDIVGHENLRTNRSLVIVANHCSHLDTLCLLAALPLRKLHRAFPAAASDYFFQSIPRLWAAAILVNALPFARQAACSTKSVALPGIARQSRDHSDYFPGRNAINDWRSWRIQIGNRRACCRTRRRGCAVLHRWIISSMAQGQTISATAKSSIDRWNASQLSQPRKREESTSVRLPPSYAMR